MICSAYDVCRVITWYRTPADVVGQHAVFQISGIYYLVTPSEVADRHDLHALLTRSAFRVPSVSDMMWMYKIFPDISLGRACVCLIPVLVVSELY